MYSIYIYSVYLYTFNESCCLIYNLLISAAFFSLCDKDNIYSIPAVCFKVFYHWGRVLHS